MGRKNVETAPHSAVRCTAGTIECVDSWLTHIVSRSLGAAVLARLESFPTPSAPLMLIRAKTALLATSTPPPELKSVST